MFESRSGIKGYAQTDPELALYFDEVFKPEDEVLAEIRARSLQEQLPEMHVAAADGRHLEVLVRFSNAKKVIEIGMLGGYSAVCIARALPVDGKLYTFDLQPKHAEVARETFRRAGVEDKIEMFIGRALNNLDRVVDKGPFDLVFIDADKVNYPKYLEWAYRNLRMGGAVIGDNAFAWGSVVEGREPEPNNIPAAREMKIFNHTIANDVRFRSTLLPTGEGLAIAVKVK